MPSIEPNKVPLPDGDKNNGEDIGGVVRIMDRIATDAEGRNVAKGRNEGSTHTYPKVIVFHFTKGEYDLPMPVSFENYDIPLIELVKEAKSSNQYFFRSQKNNARK